MKDWLEQYLFGLKIASCAFAVAFSLVVVLAGIVCGAMALLNALGVL